MRDRGLTIVVVDDDAGHVELVRRNLARAGVNNAVVTIADGREALDFVFVRGAHATREGNGQLLILLDINMPGLDGGEVLRQIKANPKTRMIPVIMLTTTDDPKEVNRCYDLGCSVYLTKPVGPADFVDAVRRLGLFISIMHTPSDPSRLL